MDENRRSVLTARVVALGACLSIVYTAVNTYLNVNFGMGFSFSAITVLLAYGLFHKLGRGSSRSEISACMLAAGMGLTVGWTLALIIFAYERLEGFEVPWWLAPPGLGQMGAEVPLSAWLTPLAVLFAIAATSTAIGLIIAYAVQPLIDGAERMVFPFYKVSATLVDACFEEGEGKLRLLAQFMALGFVITLAQSVLEALGIPAAQLDLSALLPPGFIIGVALNLAFVAVGFMIGTAVSLSMLASSLATYAILVPALVASGALAPGGGPMELYMRAVTAYLISPALGMMLLGGLLLSVFRRLTVRLRTKTSEGEVKAPEGAGGEQVRGLGYGELFSYFFRTLRERPRLAAAYVALLVCICALAYLLNPLWPLHPLVSVAVSLLSATALTLLDYAILVKMAGELGMTSGTHQFWLYSAPVLATGYVGYTPYLAMPGQGSNAAWEGMLISGFSKMREQLGLRTRDVIVARLMSWLPSFLASALFVLLAWRAWGLGSPQMPCISLMLSLPIVRMVAERRVVGIIDPITFVSAAVLGALIETLTPASMMGVAMGLLMPPYYSIPFAFGGLLRARIEKKMGREWVREKGMLICSAIITSSVLAQLATLALSALPSLL